MITIIKGRECHALRQWKAENIGSVQNIHYDNIDATLRGKMLDRLVMEQHGLCAYTMTPIKRKIDKWEAHIEHIYPRAKYAAESVSWGNLLACVPKPGEACPYGALKKGVYDPKVNKFLNPLTGGISSRLRFRENGYVEGLDDEAKETISKKVLDLNHPYLVSNRKAVIQEVLGANLSAAQAIAKAAELRRPDNRGLKRAYFEAVAQVLDAYASRLKKRSMRMVGEKRE